MKPFLLFLCVLSFSIYFAGCLSGNGKAEVGSPAPEFSLSTPDGRTIRLSDYKGKIVIVDFWATWCPLAGVGFLT
jgi:thiol-disulfide isomerase/thioredoxin